MICTMVHGHPVRRAGALLGALAALVLCTACGSRDVKPKSPPPQRELRSMRWQMAVQLVQKHDYNSAAPLVRQLLLEQPENPRLHLLMGIVLREKGALDAAETEIRKALELAPKNAEIHTALGTLLLRQRKLAKAEQAHRVAVKLAPGSARYHNDLGFCLMARRKLDEAKAELTEAIRLDPNLRVAFNNLGFVVGLSGDREGAMKAFSQAGDRAMVLTNMGYLEQLLGRPGRARRYYEKALMQRKGYPPALHNLKLLDPGAWEGYAGEGASANENNDALQEKPASAAAPTAESKAGPAAPAAAAGAGEPAAAPR